MPKILIYHFVSPSFKFNFKIIVILCLRLGHSIRCIFTNTMAMWEPIRTVRCQANYGSRGKDGPKFISCVDGRQAKVHEVWTFAEDGGTREVHLTEPVDIGSRFFGEFDTDYLNPSWHRVPMFGRNSIHGSVKWLGVTDFLRTNGPPWTANILAL